MIYWRPLSQSGPVRPPEALPLAGGPCWFTHVERLVRGEAPQILPARDAGAALDRLCAPRAPFGSLSMDRPRVMAILNVTPDSFSDGGRFEAPDTAIAQARAIAAEADILDIGGESTRPGAPEVKVQAEIARVAPVIAAIRAAGVKMAISVDSRKAAVAEAALRAGGNWINDVSALRFDPRMPAVAALTQAPTVLMHHIGTPETMQEDPRYEDVLLDVYDWLAAARDQALASGIALENIALDPGLGFGKTVAHNLRLTQGLSLFHGLGCPLLVGASRKGFIGTLAQAPTPAARMPGSLSVALMAAQQGVQILRVHDFVETRQALRLWQAVNGMDE